MKRNLAVQGNSWYLYINKSIAQMLGLTSGERKVKITVSGKTLYVDKVLKDEDDCLIKKLIDRGSGYGLNLPLPILELLDINPEVDLVDINIENNQLIIKKVD